MDKYTALPEGLIHRVQENMPEMGWPMLVAILAFICLTTRVISGLRSEKAGTDQPRSVRMVPYWFPWVGHGISFAWNHVKLVGKARDRLNEPIIGLYMGGRKHAMVVSPSMAKSSMASRSASSTTLIHYALETIFGDHKAALRSLDPAGYKEFHHTIPNHMLREPFISEATAVLVRMIELETPNLVTFCHSVVDQALWERGSDLTVVGEPGKSACEVNFFALIRNFVGQATTATLMGQAILDVYPNLLKDVWTLDDRFPFVAMGLPRWLPIPGLTAAYAARNRLLEAMAAFQQAFNYWDDGIDPGIKFRDLDDVCKPIKQRMRLSKSLGLTPQSCAPGHLSLLWAMNGNSPNIVFWHLLRLYTDPTLLEEIRKEIAPHAKASRPTREETGFPFHEPPKISIDTEGLFKSCHLLKASFYETLRLDAAPLSFRELTSDLIIRESDKDAEIAGTGQPRAYEVKKGASISVIHGVIHNDARYFSNPGQFDPLRFILADPETGARQAKLHTINPFGIGTSGCKGRVFAEKESLAFVAAIISLWDIKSVDGQGLSLPKHRPSTGVYLPKKDIRVRISSRV